MTTPSDMTTTTTSTTTQTTSTTTQTTSTTTQTTIGKTASPKHTIRIIPPYQFDPNSEWKPPLANPYSFAPYYSPPLAASKKNFLWQPKRRNRNNNPDRTTTMINANTSALVSLPLGVPCVPFVDPNWSVITPFSPILTGLEWSTFGTSSHMNVITTRKDIKRQRKHENRIQSRLNPLAKVFIPGTLWLTEEEQKQKAKSENEEIVSVEPQQKEDDSSVVSRSLSPLNERLSDQADSFALLPPPLMSSQPDSNSVLPQLQQANETEPTTELGESVLTFLTSTSNNNNIKMEVKEPFSPDTDIKSSMTIEQSHMTKNEDKTDGTHITRQRRLLTHLEPLNQQYAPSSLHPDSSSSKKTYYDDDDEKKIEEQKRNSIPSRDPLNPWGRKLIPASSSSTSLSPSPTPTPTPASSPECPERHTNENVILENSPPIETRKKPQVTDIKKKKWSEIVMEDNEKQRRKENGKEVKIEEEPRAKDLRRDSPKDVKPDKWPDQHREIRPRYLGRPSFPTSRPWNDRQQDRDRHTERPSRFERRNSSSRRNFDNRRRRSIENDRRSFDRRQSYEDRRSNDRRNSRSSRRFSAPTLSNHRRRGTFEGPLHDFRRGDPDDSWWRGGESVDKENGWSEKKARRRPRPSEEKDAWRKEEYDEESRDRKPSFSSTLKVKQREDEVPTSNRYGSLQDERETEEEISVKYRKEKPTKKRTEREDEIQQQRKRELSPESPTSPELTRRAERSVKENGLESRDKVESLAKKREETEEKMVKSSRKEEAKSKPKSQRHFAPERNAVALRPISELKPVDNTDLTNYRKKLLKGLPKQNDNQGPSRRWADIMDDDD